MTRATFNKQFAALVNAYTIAQKLSDEAQDVYWAMLKDIPEDKFLIGVRKCLAGCKFFPTIHELGSASLPKKTKTVRTAQRFVSIEQEWDEQVADIRRAELDQPIRRIGNHD